MADEKLVNKPNPIAEHHRQAAWQIWVPLGFGITAVVSLCVICAIIVLSPSINSPLSETLAPVAVIWLVIPNCLTSIIPLAILFGFIFMAAKMLRGLPKTGTRIQHFADRVEKSIQTLSDRLAAPVIKTKSSKASWDKFWEMVLPAKSKKREDDL